MVNRKDINPGPLARCIIGFEDPWELVFKSKYKQFNFSGKNLINSIF